MEKRRQEMESLKTMAVYMLQQANSLGLKTTPYMLGMIITDLEQMAKGEIDETMQGSEATDRAKSHKNRGA